MILFLEINPRPRGSVAVSEIAGIPIFSMLEKVLEGTAINKVDLKIPITISINHEAIIHYIESLKNIAGGNKKLSYA